MLTVRDVTPVSPETSDRARQSVVYASTDFIPDAAYRHLAKAAELVFCST